MNLRTRRKLALLARRLLAAQLEVDPKSKSGIDFMCDGWYAELYFFPPDRSWNLGARRRTANGRSVLRALEIPF